MRLARLVADEMKKQHLSASEVARRAGVKTSTVTRLIKGQRLGRADTVARITEVLGIDPATTQAALREEEEAEKNRHYVNLREVPTRQRARLIRMIDAFVKEWIQDKGE